VLSSPAAMRLNCPCSLRKSPLIRAFAQIKTLSRGRRRRVYPAKDYRTPFEKLSALPNWEKHLKPGMTATALERLARQLSDTEAARQMQKAKQMLLARSRGVRQ
jgi:hypothetical protein